MRYGLTETVHAAGRFPSAGTVTIQLWNPSTGLEISTSDSSCVEMGGSGLYIWSSANFTSNPSAYTEVVYTMVDISNNRYDGKFVVGPMDAELTTQQYDVLLSLYKIMGLDPSKPLVVDDDNDRRYVGDSITPDIDQTVVTAGNETTVTRIN